MCEEAMGEARIRKPNRTERAASGVAPTHSALAAALPGASMANGGILMHNTECLSLLSYIRPKTDRLACRTIALAPGAC